jgi:SEC-C motif-containing protein
MMPPRSKILNLLITWLICSASHVTGFSVKKNGGGKKRVTTGAKGFGAPALTWIDVASKCKTRLPRNADEVPCPCGSGLVYKDCCALYHGGDKLPESPIKVLRSRYTAFAWRLIKYVIETTHPACGDWRDDKIDWVKDLDKGGMFDNYCFVSLEPGPEEFESDTVGYISFTVRMKGQDGSAYEGDDRVISERSQFLRDEEGKWLYSVGEISIGQGLTQR